ncbi:MAG: tRNA (guanosine(37)-N1)-methyltransferase TrmD [bacterium]|nr:tRNA (guanosine(37)-N1)-methyltransferase TrmD [bacterium]
MLHFHIITLFPESIKPYLDASMLGRAQKDKKIKVSYYNPRDFTLDKHKRVDQRPYGGGPGMVLEPKSVLAAAKAAIGRKKNVEVIFFATNGTQFMQNMAKHLAETGSLSNRITKLGKGGRIRHIVLLCAHYEGMDARVPKILKAKYISIGPYVLTGGELPAAVVIDAVTRHVPGVLGNMESLEDLRTASPDVYTRPEVLEWQGRKYRVPKVLLSGHHKNIEEWKRKRKQ